MEQDQGPNKAVIAIIAVVLLAAVGGGVFYLTEQNDADDSPQVSANQASSSNTVTDPNATYKDGTYTATGTYQSPGGQEQIKLTVTLSGNKVASTEATTKAATGTSRQYQNEFINNYKDKIVGKNVNEVKLSRVAGSSLTSSGFNDALNEIKQEAKS